MNSCRCCKHLRPTPTPIHRLDPTSSHWIRSDIFKFIFFVFFLSSSQLKLSLITMSRRWGDSTWRCKSKVIFSYGFVIWPICSASTCFGRDHRSVCKLKRFKFIRIIQTGNVFFFFVGFNFHLFFSTTCVLSFVRNKICQETHQPYFTEIIKNPLQYLKRAGRPLLWPQPVSECTENGIPRVFRLDASALCWENDWIVLLRE